MAYVYMYTFVYVCVYVSAYIPAYLLTHTHTFCFLHQRLVQLVLTTFTSMKADK